MLRSKRHQLNECPKGIPAEWIDRLTDTLTLITFKQFFFGDWWPFVSTLLSNVHIFDKGDQGGASASLQEVQPVVEQQLEKGETQHALTSPLG